MAMLDIGRLRRRNLFHIPVIALNTGVDPSSDMCLEYNGVLARAGLEREAEEKLVQALLRSSLKWHELHVRNLEISGFETGDATGLRRAIDAPFIGWTADLGPELDLDALLHRLSANRRRQIRRSLNLYAINGPLRVHEATNLETALLYFSRLGELHNARWRRHGIDGSFEVADWVHFHEAVIRRALPRGEIQMLRIAAGEVDVGYLYNVRWRDQIAMVQSGFVEPIDNKHRPGYVCHLLAMAYNAARGITHYDFLGGEAEYKRKLGTRQTAQLNFRLQRRDVLALRVEEALVQWVRRWR